MSVQIRETEEFNSTVHLYTCVDKNNADCVVVGKPGYLVGTVLEYAEDISPKTGKPFLKIASIAKLGDGTFDTDFLYGNVDDEDLTQQPEEQEEEGIFAEPLMLAAFIPEANRVIAEVAENIEPDVIGAAPAEPVAPKRKRRSKAEMAGASQTESMQAASEAESLVVPIVQQPAAQIYTADEIVVGPPSAEPAAIIFDLYHRAKKECVGEDWLYVFQAAVGRL
jgi:hypothetical protein